MSSSSQGVTGRSVFGLGKDLYSGVLDDFLAYLSLGSATAICLFILTKFSLLGPTHPTVHFFSELGSALSSISPHILLVSIFVVCMSVALSGLHKNPGLIEKYLFHPLVALASDTSASALGFYSVSFVLSAIWPKASDANVAIEGLWYFLLASPVFWLGRAISFRYGNKRVWGTRTRPKFNRFRSIFRLAGFGGFITCVMVVILFENT